MRNAHVRLGWLRFTKVLRDTTVDVSVRMDRLIAEHAPDNRSAHCHLLSVFGNDQEIGAIAAGISEEARFAASGPESDGLMISMGPDPKLFRCSILVPGRRRAVRHLVAVSDELSRTRPGGEPSARRTVLCDTKPEFVLYRLGVRFGLPVLPEWSQWFSLELSRHHALEPLIGIGCCPVLVKGTKKRFLGWIGHALRCGAIQIPIARCRSEWHIETEFRTPVEILPAPSQFSRH